MSLKFYFNKLLKSDNIESYTLSSLKALKDSYDEFIESTEGHDPDFPMINFNTKGQKIAGTNIYAGHEDDDFKGLTDRFGNKLATDSKTYNREDTEYLEKVKRENKV